MSYVSHYVKCSECSEDHMIDDKFKLENIEEDMMGRDLATFKCEKTGELTKSLVFRT